MKNIIFALVSILFLASTVHAEPSRFYVGGVVGPGINYFKNNKNYVTIRHAAHASFAYNVFAGMHVLPWLSMEIGYLDLGFYENSGNGEGFCNRSGDCSSKQSIERPYATKITITNDIDATYYYLDAVPSLYHNKTLNIFAKVGLAYTRASLNSYVTVVPKVFGIQFEALENDYANNDNEISPRLGIGYDLHASKHIDLRTEFDYMFPTHMLKDNTEEKEGTLYPSTILFGSIYKF